MWRHVRPPINAGACNHPPPLLYSCLHNRDAARPAWHDVPMLQPPPSAHNYPAPIIRAPNPRPRGLKAGRNQLAGITWAESARRNQQAGIKRHEISTRPVLPAVRPARSARRALWPPGGHVALDVRA